MNNIKLGICMMTPEKNFIRSLLPVIYDRIFTGWSIEQGTLLPYARNNIIRAMYNNDNDFTHILFIDDDMSEFDRNHVLKLLEDDKPIVSALVCKRAPPYNLVIDFLDNTMDTVMGHIKNKEVVESAYVGMAFTLITREVFDAVRETTPDGDMWFSLDREDREGFSDEVGEFVKKMDKNLDNAFNPTINYTCNTKEMIIEAIEFGKTHQLGAVFTGEDAAFCFKAAKLGFKNYVDCGVSVSHIGSEEFDFRDSLMLANAARKAGKVQEQDEKELEIVEA